MATLAEIRAQYPQYADMSDADLASALHRKFYADMPREDFDKRVGLTVSEPDPYREAARKEIEELKARGVPVGGGGMARLIAQGATLNAADDILAGMSTPFEMVKRGTWDPREAYRHAKAREDIILEDARKNAGMAGTAAEVLGGAGSGIGLARGGLSFFGRLPANAGIGARTAASAGDAAAYGATAGAMEGNSLAERMKNAASYGVLGGVAGGAMPVAASILGTLAAPIVSNIRARVNPRGVAESQLARAISESGRAPQQIGDDVIRAAQEGQGVFTVADALGNPGQRMLSNVTRAPGIGRTEAVEFLEQRQAGQGRRIAGALAEGFDSPRTAAQVRDAMTTARDRAADAAYGANRANAAPVDLAKTIARIDETIQPGVNQIVRPQSGIANDTVETALEQVRNRLTDGKSVLTDFTAVQRVRGDLSDAVESARRAGHGNRARLLGQVLREMDAAMEDASAGFRQANRNFAQASREIEAIDAGRTAAMRGRPEDIIPEFMGQSPKGRVGYRAGYADPMIEHVQGAAFGTNKARPFTSDAFRQEAAAIAPQSTGPLMQRRLGRESAMFETRAQALGNSKTAENLADMEAMRVDPTIIGNLLSGDIGGAARNLLARVGGSLSGYTPAVREELGRMLLASGQDQAIIPRLVQTLERAIQRIDRGRVRSGVAARGVMGGAAVTPSALSAERR